MYKYKYSKKSYFRLYFSKDVGAYEIIVFHKNFLSWDPGQIPNMLGIGIGYEEYLEMNKRYNARIVKVQNKLGNILYQFPVFDDKKDAIKMKKNLENLMFMSILSGKSNKH